jgi:hypothetical protein
VIAWSVALFAGCAAPSSSTGPTASEPAGGATATPLVTPPGSVSPSIEPAGIWRPAPEQASVKDVQYLDVTWTGQRFVAIGVALGGAGTFVDSTDGLVWHEQPRSTAPGYPARLAAGPGGVVAVGSIDGQLASWTSPDGVAWTSHAGAFPTPTTGSDTFTVTDVAALDAGWLAVGREDPPCNHNCGLAPVRALVWRSVDGIAWTLVPGQASLSGAAMTGAARWGPGLVAVGSAGVDAAAWTSIDGRAWTRAADAPTFHERPSTDPSLWTSMAGVAAGEGIVVAVGFEGNGGGHGPSARAWWSTDGGTWANAEGEQFQSGGEVDVRLSQVIAAAAGFLAVGFSTGGCVGGIWASTDGRSWRCDAAASSFAGFSPSAAASSASVEVVVGLGSAPPGTDGRPGAVWRKVLP